jgi:hypothetical protein
MHALNATKSKLFIFILIRTNYHHHLIISVHTSARVTHPSFSKARIYLYGHEAQRQLALLQQYEYFGLGQYGYQHFFTRSSVAGQADVEIAQHVNYHDAAF